MALTKSMRKLARSRLDQSLVPMAALPAPTRIAPRGGWLRAVREALGMSREALARRLDVRPEAIKKSEAAEARGGIRLDTLRRMAAAMDCELVYAVVPKRSLQDIVDQRRLQLYRGLSDETLGHMALEGQSVDPADIEAAVMEEAARLYPDDRLWDESK